ncbi:TetR family transcriptional regulator [Saccharothrix carnea]|uniref:TetR family transcriptional regulator n=1 Tax=Saccharothrix carnea TaxID=1280637 RepID=UPI001C63214D
MLSVNPGASTEQIAEAAGVARTTVHRRFANRQATTDPQPPSEGGQLTCHIGPRWHPTRLADPRARNGPAAHPPRLDLTWVRVL